MPKSREKAVELSNKLLELTFRLFNCSIERKIFEPTSKPGIFYCIVCDTNVIHVHNLQEHMEGKRHIRNYFNLKDSIIMANILKYRESNEPLLGLEYVAELASTPYDSVVHYCLLCRVIEVNIINHLATPKHTEKYLAKHFPETLSMIEKYIKNNDDVKHEFLKLIRVQISQFYPLFALMLPTVCFYKEFHCRSKEALKYMESKSHINETPVFLYRIMEDLTDVIMKLEKDAKPKKNIKGDQALVQNILRSTDDFFNKLDKKRLDELKLSVALASSNILIGPSKERNERMEPLANEDLELLMSNFDELDTVTQNDLLKMLLHIKETDFERYKMLKSPF